MPVSERVPWRIADLVPPIGLLVMIGLAGLVVLIGTSTPAAAQLTHVSSNAEVAMTSSPSPEDSAHTRRSESTSNALLSHVVGRQGTTLYNRSDSLAPVASLSPRTALYRLGCEDGWCRVRTEEGRTGFAPTAAVSSIWIRVSKADRRLYLYRGPRLLDVFKVDVGYNTFADKQRRGSRTKRDHWRTPEGTFYVIKKNPRSRFYKALVLNYPTRDDARRGLKQDLISRSQYEAIVQAQKNFRVPPMNTKLGGWIEIHGEGTGGATNWTQGCVAVENQIMNELWTHVDVGTPVLIE